MKRLLLLIAPFALLFSACSHQAPLVIDEVSHSQNHVKEINELIIKTHKFVEKNKHLSAKQKKNVLKLHEESVTEISEIDQDLIRTKLVLVKTLLEPKVDAKIARMVRKEIKRLEKVRAEKLLNNYEKAQQIISSVKDIPTREKLYQSFILNGSTQRL